MYKRQHEDVTLIDKSLFRKDLVVADTVYNPEKTKMILEAEEAGCQAIGGKGMLLYCLLYTSSHRHQKLS